MRNVVRYIFLSVLFFACLFVPLKMVSSDSEFFLQANNLYAQGLYKDALAVYKKIEKKDPSVWYNIGNTVYQMQELKQDSMGSYQDAAVAWECARNQSFYSDCQDCTDNLLLVGKKIAWPQSIPEVVNGLKLYKEKAIAGYSLLFYQTWFLVYWYLLLFCLISCLFSRFLSAYFSFCKKRFVCYILLFFMLCLTCLFGFMLMRKQKQITQQSAVVFVDRAGLFFGPSHDYHQLCSLGCAEKMTVLDRRDQWLKVNYKNKIGWILGDSVELI